MTARPVRLRPRDGRGSGSRSRRTLIVETFTVVHSGAEIDQRLAGELIDAVSDWATAAGLGVTRVVEVWGPPWRRLLACCLATAAVTGGSPCIPSLPAADGLVAGLQARGLAVRYRQARQSLMNEAELRAISQGWPVRYL